MYQGCAPTPTFGMAEQHYLGILVTIALKNEDPPEASNDENFIFVKAELKSNQAGSDDMTPTRHHSNNSSHGKLGPRREMK